MIHRDEHIGNYTQVSNTLIRDRALSLQAKGLMLELLHFPDDWTFNESHLIGFSKSGKDATHNAVKELEAAGYIQRIKCQREGGRFTAYKWTVNEVPTVAGNQRGLTATVNQDWKPVPGNPQLPRPKTKTDYQISKAGKNDFSEYSF